ncbi:MAG: methyltransferase [Rhodospirillales bacterium]|nr:MAG: methyltransferase [Rhodospirillales bacterium]
MVADEDYDAARRILAEAGEWDDDGDRDTLDKLLGGRVKLRQPAAGYRVAIDPVLLAASVPVAATGCLLDAGTGVGAAALCFARRVPGARVAGLELQPEFARLARENVALNDMDDRVSIVVGDILSPPPDLAPAAWDHVIANPPHLAVGRADPPPRAAKATAQVEIAATLADWVGYALRMVRPKGSVTFIHRADRLDELLALFHGRAGGIVVFPLWPKVGRAAKRVIVRARPDVGTPMRLAAGLVLHEEAGGYTADALAILRDGAALDL